MGIGPVGGPLAKKCAELAEQAGFIRVTEMGFAGLTIGTTGKDDGVILAVQKESAAAHAGLEADGAIAAVEDKPVKPTPGKIAAKAIFGRRGEALLLTVRRNGALQEVSLVRSPQSAPGTEVSQYVHRGEADDQLARSVRSLHGRRAACLCRTGDV